MTESNTKKAPESTGILNREFSAFTLGPDLSKALTHLQDSREVLLTGLEGGALAFNLARFWLNRGRTSLVVCPTLPMAEELYKDLDFMLERSPGKKSLARLYPAYEISPYQEVDPPAEVTARRLAVLWDLLAGEEPMLVVTSAKGLTPRLCPAEYLLDNSFLIEHGGATDRDALVETLVNTGYTQASLVEQVGDFAVRGSVLDIFSPLMEEPVRVELFGDEVQSLRLFDPTDQRSQLKLKQAQIIPCHPVDLSPAAVKRAVKRVSELAAAEGLSSKKLSSLVERMELRAPFSGLESFLPIYFENAVDLFSYLPGECDHYLVEPAEVEARLRAEAEELATQFEEAREEGAIVLPPPVLRRTPDQTGQRLEARPMIKAKTLPLNQEMTSTPVVALKSGLHTGLNQELRKEGDGSVLKNFLKWVEKWREKGRDVALVCRSKVQVERLAEIFSEREVEVSVKELAGEVKGSGFGELTLLLGRLSRGFTPETPALTYVTEDEVFGAARVARKKKSQPKLSAMLAALDDLTQGDLVVHVDHGVGRYEGLVSLVVGPAESDFLLLRYKGGDKLYLPADRMGLISKYRGPDDSKPSLDQLGGKGWEKVKGRAKKAVEAIARDLVDLYAARSMQKGHAFGRPGADYKEFEAEFPYQETPDQSLAISDVLEDLSNQRPMDRLVCGDVGFGKTEVALRASYHVAMQGKQVAFLAPTTVLAEQHAQTFMDRFVSQPLEIRSLSRFKTQAEQKIILAEIRSGQTDVVVGTHRLLQKDISFKNLGLVVVDEEQRFGVRDKERLKKLRKTVDVLALTATPIPRTLQMSLSGIRDLSIISTPPAERHAIKTYLATFSPKAMREAIERELKRGGQVFFVHNRVQDITKLARMVKSLVPQAQVGIAHGQLPSKALENVMMGFVKKELDVLVCTTIIESGLDIPSANTIIINEADKLGLSQIYQLRGRVGRANQKAYAYLFIKSEASLTKDARKRLKALMDFTHLGAGFAIAMHDLQIRGAGNMLGEAQSGKAAEVGYELYVQMLEEAVARLKGEAPSEGPEPEMRLAMAAGLPEDYVPDAQVRLSLYRRLSQINELEDLLAIENELEDRFGPLPEQTKTLLDSVDLKKTMRRIFAIGMDLGPGSMKVKFAEEPKVNLERLLALAGDQSNGVTVYPDGQVSVLFGKDESPLAYAKQFLQYIGENGN